MVSGKRPRATGTYNHTPVMAFLLLGNFPEMPSVAFMGYTRFGGFRSHRAGERINAHLLLDKFGCQFGNMLIACRTACPFCGPRMNRCLDFASCPRIIQVQLLDKVLFYFSHYHFHNIPLSVVLDF